MFLSSSEPLSPREESCCDRLENRREPDPEVEKLFRVRIVSGNKNMSSSCGQIYTPAKDILKMKRPKFMSRFKNPCWVSDGRFMCIPYFWLVGEAKCGTTDLFEKIAAHPQFRRPSNKEPKWLSARRLSNDPAASLEYYATEFFGEASKAIRLSGLNDHHSDLITGEASINTIDGCILWQIMPQNQGMQEPVVNNPEYIYHINPEARILINVRNPVDRLWSEYLAFTQDKQPSAHKFHNLVVRILSIYNKCLEYRSLRSCVYSKRLADYSTMSDEEREETIDGCGKIPSDIIHLRRGVYHVFIKDYLKVFPRDHILIQRLEDVSANQMDALSEAYKFLGMKPMDGTLKKSVIKLGIRNSRKPDRRKMEMLQKTRSVLKSFYKPHNKELAKLLNDNRYKYEE